MNFTRLWPHRSPSKQSGCPIFGAVSSRLRWASSASETALPRSRRGSLAQIALAAAALALPTLVPAQTPVQQPPTAGAPPATVLLLRHAEKLTDGRIDLSPAGFARAKDLPELFLPSAAGAPRFPRPDALFATHPSKRSNRPFETIEPLSQALNLPINTDFADDDYASLAKLLLSGPYAGKVVLVAWHHGTLPQFAAALGVEPQPAPWPPTQFDRVWRIDWHDGKPTLTDLPQQLMPGDSK